MRLHKASQWFAVASLLTICAGCAGPTAEMAVQPAKQPIYLYSYNEGPAKPKAGETLTIYSLFIMGDGASGGANYKAAAFKDGARYSLAESGVGTYSIVGNTITVKAGALDAKGTIKPNEYIELGGKKYKFGMKM